MLFGVGLGQLLSENLFLFCWGRGVNFALLLPLILTLIRSFHVADMVCLVQVGIEAWKSARDSTGLTPNDYACLRGQYSYIHLVQKKLSKKSEESRHVVLDIHGAVLDCNNKWKQSDGYKSSKVASLQTEKIETVATYRHCKACEQKLAYGNIRRSLAYQPAILSMVAIAAVCVCVALLFKSSPEVRCVFEPFNWERLKYGAS